MLTRVSLLCFSASYLVVFLLEVFRLSPKVRLRMFWIWVWIVAGLVAHTSYLYQLAQAGLESRGVALSSWYHWCLIAAWALSVIYLLTSMSRPQSTVGLFFMPLILSLIGIARLMPSTQIFGPRQATSVWGALHGVSLLIGTVSVSAGFAAGLMYLVKERGLRLKKNPAARLRLPSLEWLRMANERSLIWSALFSEQRNTIRSHFESVPRLGPSRVDRPWNLDVDSLVRLVDRDDGFRAPLQTSKTWKKSVLLDGRELPHVGHDIAACPFRTIGACANEFEYGRRQPAN